MIAGLLVMDPSLKVMVVTKENAAAHAFAKHIECPCSPMCASLKAKYWHSRRLRRASLQKAHAILDGSQANSVSDGTTRFHSLFSVRFPRFATDSLKNLVCEKGCHAPTITFMAEFSSGTGCGGAH